MSRPGPFKLLFKNWKKSSFYVVGFSTALWFTYDYTVTNDLMKISAKEATVYGDERIKNPSTPIRHITVILNPVACKRKSKKLYTKWVEPLLHLAGIRVSLVETESVNQAYDLMRIMSNCDGVAIVGGDGTVHEALNGLLSRPDCTKAASNIPIAIIPAGQFNSIARYIHQNDMRYRNQKEFLIEATMKLVNSVTRKFDVLKISPLTHEDQTNATDDASAFQKQDMSSPIYALRDLRYGIYQDNFYKVSGYHSYQTYIKPVWLRLKRAFGSNGNNPKPEIESLFYTAPCEGCSACFEKHRLQDNQPARVEEPSINRKWWSMVAPAKTDAPSEEETRQLELSKRENPNCQQWVGIGDLKSVTDFRACMMGDIKVRLSLARQREYSPSDACEVQDVRLKLAPELDAAQSQASQTVESGTNEKENTKETEKKKSDDEKKTVQFLVDGQPTQARSVEITAIDMPVTLFTGRKELIITEADGARTRPI